MGGGVRYMMNPTGLVSLRYMLTGIVFFQCLMAIIRVRVLFALRGFLFSTDLFVGCLG